MAGRSAKDEFKVYRYRMWDMTRIKIRDILNTPFKNAFNLPKNESSPAKIGEVFTSEKAVDLPLSNNRNSFLFYKNGYNMSSLW